MLLLASTRPDHREDSDGNTENEDRLRQNLPWEIFTFRPKREDLPLEIQNLRKRFERFEGRLRASLCGLGTVKLGNYGAGELLSWRTLKLGSSEAGGLRSWGALGTLTPGHSETGNLS